MHKIIYASSSTLPSTHANGVHVMKMCQAFSELGHDVTLLCPKRKDEIIVDNLWAHYGVRKPFPIQWLPATSALRELDYAFSSAFFAKKWGATLCYTRHIPIAWASARLGVPVICELHDPGMGRLRRFLFRALLKSAYLKKMIVITHALEKHLVAATPKSAGRFSVEPDAVDLEAFLISKTPSEARSELGMPPSRFTVGYAGHLYAGRGIEIILELAQEMPDIDFLLIGGKKEDVQKYRSQNESLKNLKFLGFIPNSELPRHLAACDVLLMPYQKKLAVSGGGDTAQWMSPMKMFEYMATKRPIISSDLPALREILNPKLALFCGPDQTAEWKQAILKLKGSEALRNELASNARKEVERYSWQARVKRILSGI